MSDAPLSDDLGRRAGFPWYYPVVFLLNFALVLLVQLLGFYRTPLPLTEEALAKKVPEYSDAVIVNSTYNSTYTWYLVEAGDGACHLVPVQRNQIFQNQGRIRADQIAEVPAGTAYTEVTTGGTTVMVGTDVEPWGNETQEHPLKMRSKYGKFASSSAGRNAFTLLAFLALALSILEAVLWHKIKG